MSNRLFCFNYFCDQLFATTQFVNFDWVTRMEWYSGEVRHCRNIVSGWTRNWYEYPVGISCSNVIRKALMKSGFFVVIVKFQCSRLIRLTVIVSFSISSVILFCRCKSSHIVENGDCVRSRTLNLMIWSRSILDNLKGNISRMELKSCIKQYHFVWRKTY